MMSSKDKHCTQNGQPTVRERLRNDAVGAPPSGPQFSHKNPSAYRKAHCYIWKSQSPKLASSEGSQAGEARGGDTLLLDEDVEALAHAFREDEGFEPEAGPDAVCLAVTLVIEIGKIVSLPERQKKSGLCDETEGFKPVALTPEAQCREINVRRKVLLTGGSVEVFAGAVMGVGKDRTGQVVGIKQVGRFMTVVDGKDEAVMETAGDFGDPITGFQAGFRLLAIFERDLLSGEIFRDGTGGKGQAEFAEACAIPGDEDFSEGALLLKDTVNGERVNEFVGEKTTRRDARGKFDRRVALPFPDKRLEAPSQLIAAGRRALHSDIVESLIELRQLRLGKLKDVTGEPAHSRAGFYKKKIAGAIQSLPHFSELASQQAAEDGMHIHTGVIVRETLGFFPAVIAIHGVVEALAHVFSEGDGAKATETFCEKCRKRVHAEAAPEARSFWSCCQISWKTSQAAASKRTK
jgi:hypothetical protein